ncbi:MAG: hypothetical protein AAGI53_06185 [Planctomycetota bacterium]
MRSALFGGALLCAGVAQASAGVLDFTYATVAVAYTATLNDDQDLENIQEIDQRAYAAPFEFASSVVNAKGSAIANFGSDALLAQVTAAGPRGVAAAYLFAVFTVDRDTDVVLSWDLTAEPIFDSGRLVFERGPGEVLLSFDFEPNASSMTFTLEAGVEYGLTAAVSSSVDGRTGFLSLVAPGTSGVGVLALSVVLALRRRR